MIMMAVMMIVMTAACVAALIVMMTARTGIEVSRRCCVVRVERVGCGGGGSGCGGRVGRVVEARIGTVASTAVATAAARSAPTTDCSRRPGPATSRAACRRQIILTRVFGIVKRQLGGHFLLQSFLILVTKIVAQFVYL